MEKNGKKLILVLTLVPTTLLIVFLFLIYLFRIRTKQAKQEPKDLEKDEKVEGSEKEDEELEREDLFRFQGGENLTIHDILDAPGEVIGKSSYGTLYKAIFERTSTLALLRFLRPACTGLVEENVIVIRMLGAVRHPNLVPLIAFYSGPRGEKLLVYPFVSRGNLAEFLRGGNRASHKWDIIYRISLGIARAMEYLHEGLPKPVIHGNLKSRNILLDGNYQPYVSDFGLHLIFNSTTGQEMLEAAASQGYKAPELIKMKDVSKESDIYNIGIVLLEILTGKELINENPPPNHPHYLPDQIRDAIVNHRISDMFHPDILLNQSKHRNSVTQERLLSFVQLAMACCSPSPYLRPQIKQVVKKLEEIGQ